MGALRHAIPHRPGSLGRLAAHRKERDWLQSDLAERAGITTLTVSRAENGRAVTSDTVYKLARALDVEPGELMTPEDDIE